MSTPNPTSDTCDAGGPWVPTHTITLTGREPIRVMLLPPEVPGAGQPAYTRAEWLAYDASDFTVNAAGEWHFQGQPFNGAVETA